MALFYNNNDNNNTKFIKHHNAVRHLHNAVLHFCLEFSFVSGVCIRIYFNLYSL